MNIYTPKNIVGSPNCNCGEIETTDHYFLHCPANSNERRDLFPSLSFLSTVTLKIIFGKQESENNIKELFLNMSKNTS